MVAKPRNPRALALCQEQVTAGSHPSPDAATWLTGTREYQPMRVRVCDMTTGGAGLETERPLVAGDSVRLQLPLCQAQASITLAARVRGCAPAPGHTWRIGCEFLAPLSAAVLASL
jgi:hypothetical protein